MKPEQSKPIRPKNVVLTSPKKGNQIVLPNGQKIQLLKWNDQYLKLVEPNGTNSTNSPSKTINNRFIVNPPIGKLTPIKKTILIHPKLVNVPKFTKTAIKQDVNEIIDLDDEPDERIPKEEPISTISSRTTLDDSLGSKSTAEMNDFPRKLVIIKQRKLPSTEKQIEIKSAQNECKIEPSTSKTETNPPKEIAMVSPNIQNVPSCRVQPAHAAVKEITSKSKTQQSKKMKPSKWSSAGRLDSQPLVNVPITGLYQLLKEKFVPLVGHACTLAIVDHIKMAFVRCHISKIRAIRDLIQYVDNFKRYQVHKDAQDKVGQFISVGVQTDDGNENAAKNVSRNDFDLDKELSLKALLFKDFSTALEPNVFGYMPIHNAVIENDITSIGRMLMVLEKLNELDVKEEKHGMTALHLAIYTNAGRSVIQLLLNAGLSLEVCDDDGENCIHLAVRYGNYVLLQTIVNKLNNLRVINCNNCEGHTPLMLCARLNKFNEAKVLVDNFADLNVTDPKSGRTVLFYSIEQNNFEMTKLFLENGADIRKRSFSGMSAYDASMEMDNLDTELRQLLHVWNYKKTKRPNTSMLNGRNAKHRRKENDSDSDSS